MKIGISVLVVAAAVLGSCSNGSDDDTQPTSVSQAPAVSLTSPEVIPGETPGSEDDQSEPTAPSASGPVVTIEVIEVPEPGIPGLDSDDGFCAGWSRFGGSWQVLAVAAAFLEDPVVVAELEVMASPTVTSAFETLMSNFPDELADEEDIVADGYFGPFVRRSDDALQALIDVGATDEQLSEIEAEWELALARRSPESADLRVELTEGTAVVVSLAAEMFTDQRVSFHTDPSMIIVAETPQTDLYLETACPDQGSLTGQEVPG